MIIGEKSGVTIDQNRDFILVTTRNSCGEHPHYFIIKYSNCMSKSLSVVEKHAKRNKLTMEEFVEQYERRGGLGKPKIVELHPGNPKLKEFVYYEKFDGYMVMHYFNATKKDGVKYDSYKIQTPDENSIEDADVNSSDDEKI